MSSSAMDRSAKKMPLLLLFLLIKTSCGFQGLAAKGLTFRSDAATKQRLFVATAPTLTSDAEMSASEWHRQRRKAMMSKYREAIAPLERDDSSKVGFALLIATCASLWGLSLSVGDVGVWQVVLLSIFPGSILSLWQLQLLHDVAHGSMFKTNEMSKLFGMTKLDWQDRVLFWCSMPSVFGYYLYLKAGHISHHSHMGEHSLAEVFDSSDYGFEDGDLLFTAHRMKLKGDYGPSIPLPLPANENNEIPQLKMSVSRSGFFFWQEDAALANAVVFATSFLFERVLLCVNDVFVAILGINLFFPNKPQEFQDDCVAYARVATAFRTGLWLAVGWKAILFLYLSESLWSLPPHPACAMFISNHGSTKDDDGKCIPTNSTYAGWWYSLVTLGTNFHCEHHDFPSIPFHRLHELRKIAPEYYRDSSSDDLIGVMRKTFSSPEFYCCMDAGEFSRSGTIRDGDNVPPSDQPTAASA